MKTLTIMTIVLLLALCSFSPAQVFLDLEIINQNMQILSLGDLDFANTGLTTNLFYLHIRNDGPTTQTLSLTLIIRYNGIEIASGSSEPFDLPGNYSKTISSQELSAGTADINGQSISLGNYDVKLDNVPGFENQAIQTGMAPAGTYQFEITGLPGPIGDPVQNNTITISNPTYIELLFPGNSVGDPSVMEINTTTPYCQWQTDVQPGNVSCDIFFYEKLAMDNSVEDVLAHPPVLQVEGYPNNFLQYPPSSSGGPGFIVVRPLEAGKTYYWFVRSNIQGGIGTQTIESDVFRFRIADLAQASTNAQQILAILQQLLGTNYAQVLTTLTIQGFDPNGTISLDGQGGDINTLLDVANKVASGQLSIEDVQVY